MPSKYKRKKLEPKYTLEDINAALLDLKSHKCTYQEASAKYKVPKSVLFRRAKCETRKLPTEKLTAGTKCQVPKQIEDTLEGYVIARSEWGFPVDKQELLDMIQALVRDMKLVTNFSNDRPGEAWYRRFMRDHPRISLKKPEQLQKCRVNAADPFVVNDFYDKLESVIQKYNLKNRPHLVFNCDESAFPTDPNNLLALGEKGKKSFYRQIGGTGRENISVNSCVTAAGDKVPPHIIFKGQAVQCRWVSKAEYPGTCYSATTNGYMEECVFFMWLTESFVPFVNEMRAKHNESNSHAVLIYDGHRSHISVRVIRLALDNKIVLVRLPSHLTHRLQPLDLAVFGPVKTAWGRKMVEHGKKNMGASNFYLTRETFSKYVGEVWRDTPSKNIIAGFKETGLFPIDRSKFPISDYPLGALDRYNASVNNNTLPVDAEAVENDPHLEDVAEPFHEDNRPPSTPSGQNTVAASGIFHSLPSTSAEASTQPSTVTGKKLSPEIREVADIFMSRMKAIIQTKPAGAPIPVERQIRLRNLRYGEVLTSKSVFKRISEEEARRNIPLQKKKPVAQKRKKTAAVEETSSSEGENLDASWAVETPKNKKKSAAPKKRDDAVMTDLNRDEGIGMETPKVFEVGQYYAASYDSRWYVGRILRLVDDRKYELKFLERLGDVFRWPARDDIDQVHSNMLFCGPIVLKGVTSFKLNPCPKDIHLQWEKSLG